MSDPDMIINQTIKWSIPRIFPIGSIWLTEKTRRCLQPWILPILCPSGVNMHWKTWGGPSLEPFKDFYFPSSEPGPITVQWIGKWKIPESGDYGRPCPQQQWKMKHSVFEVPLPLTLTQSQRVECSVCLKCCKSEQRPLSHLLGWLRWMERMMTQVGRGHRFGRWWDGWGPYAMRSVTGSLPSSGSAPPLVF